MIPDSRKGFEGTTNSFFEKDFRNFMRDAFNESKDDEGGNVELGRGGSRGGVKQLGLLESFGNIMVGVPIESEDFAKVGKLLVNIAIITNAKSPKSQGFEHSNFLARVVVGRRIEI